MTSTKDPYTRLGEAYNALHAHIPLPEGAHTTTYWSPVPDDPAGRFWRDLEWWENPSDVDVDSDEASVGIAGVQFSDGQVDRDIYVIFDNDARGEITSCRAARKLAIRLLEAADRLDALDQEIRQ